MEHFSATEVDRLTGQLGKELKSGDIIYRSSDVWSPDGHVPFSRLVEHATGSPYSHAALAISRNGSMFVFEVNEDGAHLVKLESWVSGRYGRNMAVYRLKEISVEPFLWEDFVTETLMANPGYDFSFSSSGCFYCTEMVMEAYRRCANVVLMPPEYLSDIIQHYVLWTPLITAVNFALKASGSRCYLPSDRPLYYPGTKNRGMCSSKWTEEIFESTSFLAAKP